MIIIPKFRKKQRTTSGGIVKKEHGRVSNDARLARAGSDEPSVLRRNVSTASELSQQSRPESI
jgi:hypothetical protein